MRRTVALGALAALALAGHGVRSSQAAFTAPVKSNAATFATAADWLAPAVTLTAPADGSYSKTTSVRSPGPRARRPATRPPSRSTSTPGPPRPAHPS